MNLKVRNFIEDFLDELCPFLEAEDLRKIQFIFLKDPELPLLIEKKIPIKEIPFNCNFEKIKEDNFFSEFEKKKIVSQKNFKLKSSIKVDLKNKILLKKQNSVLSEKSKKMKVLFSEFSSIVNVEEKFDAFFFKDLVFQKISSCEVLLTKVSKIVKKPENANGPFFSEILSFRDNLIYLKDFVDKKKNFYEEVIIDEKNKKSFFMLVKENQNKKGNIYFIEHFLVFFLIEFHVEKEFYIANFLKDKEYYFCILSNLFFFLKNCESTKNNIFLNFIFKVIKFYLKFFKSNDSAFFNKYKSFPLRHNFFLLENSDILQSFKNEVKNHFKIMN